MLYAIKSATEDARDVWEIKRCVAGLIDLLIEQQGDVWDDDKRNTPSPDPNH